MATAIGTRAAKHGHTIELMSRNTAKAQALADQIGNGATAARSAQRRRVTSPSWPSCTPTRLTVVANYGDSLAGKILVDISNPFDIEAAQERLPGPVHVLFAGGGAGGPQPQRLRVPAAGQAVHLEAD